MVFGELMLVPVDLEEEQVFVRCVTRKKGIFLMWTPLEVSLANTLI
jgi:hypothetical protein